MMKALALTALVLAALTPVPATAETANVNGMEMHYTVSGAGEPLVLLHGFGSCGADWGSIGKALADKHKVIAIDARGHGESTNPSGKFSHPQAAEDIRALLDALKIDKASAIGFSSGGITLLHLASRHPERLSKMVVIGATTHFPVQARAILKSASMDTIPPDVLAVFRECATHGDAQVRSLLEQFRAFGFSTDDTNLQPSDLAKITAETLIIHGDRDIFFAVAIPVGMYGSIKKSQLWIVPNGDHSPTGGADEAAFVKKVRAFLEP